MFFLLISCSKPKNEIQEDPILIEARLSFDSDVGFNNMKFKSSINSDIFILDVGYLL
tara:strand:- start:310 stop:480 length:171 start_codon:yes stop_codon:yes gene_type:complete